MKEFQPFFRAKDKFREYEPEFDHGEIDLSFDFTARDHLTLDVSIAAKPLTIQEDGEAFTYKLNFALESAKLLTSVIGDRDFRRLDGAVFHFHVPVVDGYRNYTEDSPGWIYLGNYRQFDDLELKLQYLGQANFRATIVGNAEMDTNFSIDAVVKFKSVSTSAMYLGADIDPTPAPVAKNAAEGWTAIAAVPDPIANEFSRLLNPLDFNLTAHFNTLNEWCYLRGEPKECMPVKN